MTLNRLALFLGAGLLAASCTTTSVPQKTSTDDMYAKSGDVVLPKSLSNNSSTNYSLPYDDSYDRLPEVAVNGGSDEYFDESYLTTRDYKGNIGVGSYNEGYAAGYSQGWTDNTWTMGSGRFMNSPFGYYGNSWNSFYSPLRFSIGFNIGMGGFWNRPYGWSGLGGFYSPWDPFYGSYAYGGWGYPYFGYNSFYSPWGYNSFYSPWGYRSYDMFGWRNPYSGYYGGVNNIYVTNNYGPSRGVNTGSRNATLANSRYNDRIVSRTNNAARIANNSTSYDRSTRQNSTSSVNRNSGINNRGENTYNNRAASSRVNSGTVNRGTSDRSTGYRNYSDYSRQNSGVRSSAPASNRGYTPSSSNSRGGSYSAPATRNSSTYSRPATGNSNYGGYSPSQSRSSQPSYSPPASSGGGRMSSGGGVSSGGGSSSSGGGGGRGRG